MKPVEIQTAPDQVEILWRTEDGELITAKEAHQRWELDVETWKD